MFAYLGSVEISRTCHCSPVATQCLQVHGSKINVKVVYLYYCTLLNIRFFTFTWPSCKVTNFFVIKPTRCTNFTNLIRHETLHVSGRSSAHHQEFIHCTLGTSICHTGLQTAESCLQTCMTYTIAECTVNKLLMMYRRTVRNI